MKTYVQIGACIGHDEFQIIVGKNTEQVKIILIEPNIEGMSQLVQNYKELMFIHDISICPYAISLSTGKQEFYKYPTIVGNDTLLNRKNHPLQDSSILKTIETKTFDDFCKQYRLDNIECLFIDAEGMDYEILNSIDLSKININMIIFEEWVHEQDDINANYRTGPTFLHYTLVPKFHEYYWEELASGGMNNFKLTKKSSI